MRREARRYWDAHPILVDTVEHAPGTRASFDAMWAGFEERLAPRQEYQAFVERCRGRRMLEMGCGIAMAGRLLSEHGADYFGIDASRRSLALAQTHLGQQGLRARFTNADGTSLPFADGTFEVVLSDGVVHHIPDMERACRELVRVTAPGGTVRVMVYNRRSYHYALVRFVVCPLLWLAVRVGWLGALARRGPAKLRNLYEISRAHGYDPERILAASTDTSMAGEGNFNPLSHFLIERELRRIFRDLEDPIFIREQLKYFPLPFPPLRRVIEKHWGFFLTITARKPSRPAQA